MEPLAAGDPRQVGPYRLSFRLGAGGMGRVFLGLSPAGRAVAVKVIHPQLAQDPEFVRRFRLEAAAAEAVSGAYTAPVVAAGPDDDPPWLATAFVAGPSLAEAVAGAGPLPEAAVWKLAGGLVEALQAVHARGLVHRDLTPANVLLAADGPRVIDFGISRALEGTSVTVGGAIVGTPAFMSPEQAEGSAVGPAGDVFSLGCVIAFAATGAAPFGSGEPVAVLYRLVHARPDLSGLPDSLRDLVVGCLSRAPGDRPSLGRLVDAIMAGSAPYPAASPVSFWPEPVAGLVSSRQDSFRAQVSPGASPEPANAAAQSPRRDPAGRATAVPGQHGAGVTRQAPARSPGDHAAPPQPDAGLVGESQATKPRRSGTRRSIARRWPVIAGVAVIAVIVLLGPGRELLTAATGHNSAGQHRDSAGLHRARSAPAAPSQVAAVPVGQYAMKVTWIDSSAGVTGFRVDNGCPAGSCSPGAILARTTGQTTAADFAVTPGAYDCFRVQAFNSAGASPWSGYGCTSTPGLSVSANQVWSDTGVYLRSGEALGIAASGKVLIDGTHSLSPYGDKSCIPDRNYHGISPPFIAPSLHCWALVARIGNSPPFEIGTHSLVAAATSGFLYLSVNDNDFTSNSGHWIATIKIGGSA